MIYVQVFVDTKMFTSQRLQFTVQKG